MVYAKTFYAKSAKYVMITVSWNENFEEEKNVSESTFTKSIVLSHSYLSKK